MAFVGAILFDARGHPASSMRLLLVALLALLAAPVFAGCASRPTENTGSTPPTSAATSTTQQTQFTPGAAGFAVDNFTAVPSDGRHRPLHEDDNVTFRYTLRNPASSGAPTSFLVSFLLGREVKDVQTITLAPGANRSFTQPFGSVRGLNAVDAEVRAGDQSARLHVAVTAWPRVGETLDLGPGLLTVNNFVPNATSNGTDVIITFSQRALPQGELHQTRIRMLCADQRGRVSIVDDTLPDVPGPDASVEWTLPFRGCAQTVYGTEVTGLDAKWKEFYSRVLFVPVGWAPPQS